MNDICKTGPFAYRDEKLQADLTTIYTFKFNWGGDLIYHQVVKNPCNSKKLIPSNSNKFKQNIQIISPLTIKPKLIFHSFDQRRGLFTDRAIKRMYDEQTNVPDFTKQPKIPRLFPPVELKEREEKDSDSETKTINNSQKKKTKKQKTLPVQQQLRLQLREQQRLRVHLQHLFLQLQKTKANLHLNPLSFQQKIN